MVSAPAEIILLGEHAAVYGKPAIAVPISSLRATASWEKGDDFQIIASDLNQHITITQKPLDNALAVTAQLTLEQLKTAPPQITLTLQSQIPLASGLGSGAAVSTALVRAICEAINHPLSNEAINEIVYEVEKMHHGTPSGIDNTVIVYEQPIFFVRQRPIEQLAIRGKYYFVIADTGKGALTKIAVSDVRRLYEQEPERIQLIFDEIGAIVQHGRAVLEQGDATTLGKLMTQNHQHLQELTVSSTELDKLVNIALNAGALGAKLSGGGRGGNMIALVSPEMVSIVQNALTAAGATRTFTTILS